MPWHRVAAGEISNGNPQRALIGEISREQHRSNSEGNGRGVRVKWPFHLRRWLISRIAARRRKSVVGRNTASIASRKPGVEVVKLAAAGNDECRHKAEIR